MLHLQLHTYCHYHSLSGSWVFCLCQELSKTLLSYSWTDLGLNHLFRMGRALPTTFAKDFCPYLFVQSCHIEENIVFSS